MPYWKAIGNRRTAPYSYWFSRRVLASGLSFYLFP
jgi:hypothetical protein